MDRRQRKSREAIFRAFEELLKKRDFAHITVGEIIEKADVGRATFYAHFETKEFLLKELCEELFCHIFDAEGEDHHHKHIFECDEHGSAFFHLFSHIKKNDNNLLSLLSSSNNEIFLGYFKENLLHLSKSQLDLLKGREVEKLPEDFKVNHIASVFVEVLKWWINTGLKESEETITEYFYMAL
ncbi:MAG: TetR/AcrR family transcriptional regulator [Ruminococcaceae bacterium]|nr:TetR/AcrR family transcriptional regulator [Oscillospiraceae bacterium]